MDTVRQTVLGDRGPTDRRGPLLSPDEERQLAHAMEVGVLAQEALDRGGPDAPDRRDLARLVQEGREARECFFWANVGLVHQAVTEISRTHHCDPTDAFQQGCLALSVAIMAFDHRRGTKLSTLAYTSIRREVMAFVRQGAVAVAVPPGRLSELDHVQAVRWQLREEGAIDTPDAVAARLHKPVDWVEQRWERPGRRALHAGDADLPMEPDDADSVEEWLAELPRHEREAVVLRFGLCGVPACSVPAIARQLRCSQAEVRRRVRQGCERLKSVIVGEMAG